MKCLKDGLSGFMRAKNESQFVEICIDSCINALDELIVVYNDCTDKTPEILERKRKQYPDKLKIYKYEYHVLGFNLTKEEFEYAKKMPINDPRLFCNQCNYALSKITCKYAIVIDPDQTYFEDEIRKWRDVCSGSISLHWKMGFILGWFFMMYISLYRRLSNKIGRPYLMMIPQWLIDRFKRFYQEYSKWRLQKGKAAITLSGVNLFWDKEWYVTFDNQNVHPPYNGATDHLIFKLTEDIHFDRHFPTPLPYAITEALCQPNKVMFADHPAWFHQHANRYYCWEKVKKIKNEHKDWFIPIQDFIRMNYDEVLEKMDPQVNTLFQRTLFALVHKMGLEAIKKHLWLLDAIEEKI